MPEWGIILLIVGAAIFCGVAAYVPIMNKIKSIKFKRERTENRKITVDKLNKNHIHLLLEKSISRPFYAKYFTNLSNEYEVKSLKTKITFNLDLFESDYANIIADLNHKVDPKYHELVKYLIDTDLNIIITNIFSEITNHFIIPNLEALNEEREIVNEDSDEYYAQWIIDYREQTIKFICNTYLLIVYNSIIELIQTQDIEKYSIQIRTIITTKYQEVIFNSLEKKFVSLAYKMVDTSKNIGDNMTNEEVKNRIREVARKFKVDFDKIYNHNLKISKLQKMFEKIK